MVCAPAHRAQPMTMGRSPDGCDCMNLKRYTGSLTWATAGIFFAIAALTLLALGLIINVAYGADNARPCLTKEQARAKWRTEWIYWHGSNHCWDNVRGTAATANKPDNTVQIIRAPKSNRATKGGREDTATDANGNNSIKGPSIYFPDLMPGNWTDGSMLRPDGMTWWPVLIDVDAQPQFVPWQKRISSSLTSQEKP